MQSNMNAGVDTNNFKSRSTRKFNQRNTQAETIFRFLQDHTATASMITEATGIPQRNIYRYKRDMEKAGKLWEVKKDHCQHTYHLAWYLTTDPGKAPDNAQEGINR